MTQLITCFSEELSPEIQEQLDTLFRKEWPQYAAKQNQSPDWMNSKSGQLIHFMVTDGNQLISHAAVAQKTMTHAGTSFKTYGISGTVTHPSFRGKGYGMQVVIAAKKHLELTDADIVLFHSIHEGFYEQAGFEYIPTVNLLKGNPANPTRDDERVYMLFLSEKGKRFRYTFESIPVYFGEEVW